MVCWGSGKMGRFPMKDCVVGGTVAGAVTSGEWKA